MQGGFTLGVVREFTYTEQRLSVQETVIWCTRRVDYAEQELTHHVLNGTVRNVHPRR
jgi:hypothetical protein